MWNKTAHIWVGHLGGWAATFVAYLFFKRRSSRAA
jgi:hypothetical protein